MNDEESKIETEVAKFVSIPSSPTSADGSEKSAKKKKKTPRTVLLGDSTEPTVDIELTDIEHQGMRQILLSSEDQSNLHCVIGVHVTTDAPWTSVPKSDLISILDNADYKKDLQKLQREDVLVGYDSERKETKSGCSVFYVAVTEEANLKVEEQLREERRAYESKLAQSVNRVPRPWKSLGSELEIVASSAVNTRPLINIEIDTKPEDLMKPVSFKEDNRGFLSIGPGRTVFKGIPRLRIDTGIQAVPPLNSEAVQTDPGLPVNSWSQYVYDLETAQEAAGEKARLELPKDYKFQYQGDMERALLYNETLNLYTNDYPLLVQKPEDAQIPELKTFEHFESYADVRHCFGKVVPNIAWHPMWSDIVAVPYGRTTRAQVTSATETNSHMQKDVFMRNNVLIWSFSDSLRPKLVLLCPREVRYVRWCTVDPHILAGVCVSGQLVVWDIQDRLDDMGHSDGKMEYLDATAMSSLEFSHKGAATYLRWMSPFHAVDKHGHYQMVNDFSMQLMTCGEDGAVMIWDLNVVPGEAVDYRRRVMGEDTKVFTPPGTQSRFKDFDRFIKPIYIIKPSEKDGPMLTSLCVESSKIDYELVSEEEKVRKLSCAGDENSPLTVKESHRRKVYRPVFQEMPKPEPRVTVGTESGAVLQFVWEGFEVDEGALVAIESVEPCSIGTGIHDGAVTCVAQSRFIPSLILTVGGFVLALWSTKLPNNPIFWRTRPSRLSSASWSPVRPSSFRITRLDGYLEVWDLLTRSDHPVLEQSVSGEPATTLSNHRFPHHTEKHILAIADYCNAMKLYYMPQDFAVSLPSDLSKMCEYEENEVKLRMEYKSWNERYSAEYPEEIKIRVDPPIKHLKVHAEEDKKLKRLMKAQSKAAKKFKEDEEFLLNVLLRERKLNRKELMIKQAPKIALEKMDEERKAKQREKLREQSKYFDELMMSMFPDIVKEESPERSLVEVMLEEIEGGIDACMDGYDDLEERILEDLSKKEFDREIEWKGVWGEASERRAALDAELYLKDLRHQRLKVRKEEWLLNPPPVPPTPTPRSGTRGAATSIALLVAPPADADPPPQFDEEDVEEN